MTFYEPSDWQAEEIGSGYPADAALRGCSDQPARQLKVPASRNWIQMLLGPLRGHPACDPDSHVYRRRNEYRTPCAFSRKRAGFEFYADGYLRDKRTPFDPFSGYCIDVLEVFFFIGLLTGR